MKVKVKKVISGNVDVYVYIDGEAAGVSVDGVMFSTSKPGHPEIVTSIGTVYDAVLTVLGLTGGEFEYEVPGTTPPTEEGINVPEVDYLTVNEEIHALQNPYIPDIYAKITRKGGVE